MKPTHSTTALCAALLGSAIHGGLKRNIISDEVKLELTLRAFDDQVMAHLVASPARSPDGSAPKG